MSEEISGGSVSIAGLVLAAGASTRMGRDRNKLTLDIGDRPMLNLVVDAFRDAGVAPISVVLGHEAAAVEGILMDDVEIIRHEGWAAGMGSSIARGIGAVEVSRQPDAFLLCVGDLPGLRSDSIRSVCEAFLREGDSTSIVVPTFEGRDGHPVLFGRAHVGDLVSLHGDRGARKILEARADCVIRVPVIDDGILRDVDTPEALRDWRGRDARSED